MPTLKSRELQVIDVSISKAEEGWALKEARKSYRLNEAQKSYLEAKYNIGQTTGRKLDAETVAREMRRSIGPDGNRLFRVSEFLTSQQVSSFFSRLAAKSRNNIVVGDDIRASQEDINFDTARHDILSHLQQEHPIVYDQYDICSLARKGTLKSLKLGLLQSLCVLFIENTCQESQKQGPLYCSSRGDGVMLVLQFFF